MEKIKGTIRLQVGFLSKPNLLNFLICESESDILEIKWTEKKGLFNFNSIFTIEVIGSDFQVKNWISQVSEHWS